VLALLAFGVPASAQETPSTCTTFINALPYTIEAPGTYCLRANSITQSHYGVQIQSSNVVLNCRGRTVEAAVPQVGTDGISTMSGLDNVTVQNCVVKGFDRGITVGNQAHGAQVLNNRVENGFSDGIIAWGHNARVINNRVSNMHPASGQQVVGISLMPFSPEISATGQELINNTVASMSASYLLVGLMVSGSTDPRVINNHVLDLQPGQGAYSASIWLTGWAQGANTTGGQLINNASMARREGVQAMWGQPALCRGNTAVGLTFGFTGCLSESDNVSIP
jgi:hypothetical protein